VVQLKLLYSWLCQFVVQCDQSTHL